MGCERIQTSSDLGERVRQGKHDGDWHREEGARTVYMYVSKGQLRVENTRNTMLWVIAQTQSVLA